MGNAIGSNNYSWMGNIEGSNNYSRMGNLIGSTIIVGWVTGKDQIIISLMGNLKLFRA